MVQGQKAQLHWCKVRSAVFGSNRDEFNRLKLLLLETGDDNVVKKDKDPTVLAHGIKIRKEIAINYLKNQSKVSINRVTCCTSKIYLILFTDGNICLCSDDGDQQLFSCKEPIISICYAEKFNSYVAVCADNNLRILDENLVLINAIPYSGFICGIAYNGFTHEIITYGKGSLIVWLFRTSGTLLIPKLVISEKIARNDSIDDICIERTYSENQRCFSVLKAGVLIHKLLDGSCIQSLQGIHDSLISNVLYFQPLKLLITSGKDGCIKSWNEDGTLNCIFIGHTAEVTSISPLPFEPKMISASKDGTLRTWNLETYIETDCHKFEYAVQGCHTLFQKEEFCSFTKDLLYIWGSNHLYTPSVVLKSKAEVIKTTTNPHVPPLSYCICEDASIYIICPVNRKIVSFFRSPDDVSIADAVFHISENLLIVLLVDGTIIQSSTTNDICETKNVWKSDLMKICTSISLYEYMPKNCDEDDQWEQLHQNTFAKHQIDGCSDKVMLFGGSNDGTIVLYDWMDDENNGTIVFSLQAHLSEVTAMSSNPKMDQLASTSLDKTLKIWRVFPFAEEALTPLLLFEDSLSINGIMFANKTLCVIYQDMVRAYYTIGMYKTSHDVEERCVPPDVMKDHTDVILSLATCPKLDLVASSSKDGDIHIRDTDNNLLNILKLNDISHSISFCSQRGNLLLAIGTQIHIIDYKQYMPPHCLKQMIGKRFVETVLDDKNRAESPYHSPFIEFVDNISNEELKKKEEENKVKQHAYSILKARDEELNMIIDGKLKTKRELVPSALDKDLAFKKYMDIFYQRPDIPYPEDDVEIEQDDFIVKVESSFRPVDDKDGFFSVDQKRENIKEIRERILQKRKEEEEKILSRDKPEIEAPVRKIRSLSIETDNVDLMMKEKISNRPQLSASTTYVERLQALKNYTENNKQYKAKSLEKIGKIVVSSDEYPLNKVTKTNVNKRSVRKFKEETACEKDPPSDLFPVAPDGFIPNSVVVALYKELKRESETVDEDWRPKDLTEEQLNQINAHNARMMEDEEEEEVVQTQSHDDTDKSSSTWTFPSSEEKESSILDELVEIKKSIPKIDSEDLATPPDTPPDSPPPVKKAAPPRKPMLKKPIVKLISTAVALTKTIQKPPTPPPPPPPLPDFVLQFAENEWYKIYFADLTYESLEQPHSIGNFVKLLLKTLKVTKEYDVKKGLVNAIMLLMNQERFDDEISELVQNEILASLNESDLHGEKTGDQEDLIRVCLQLLLALKGAIPIIVSELMTQFILSPPMFRKEIMKTFEELGLQDSKDLFPAELHSFDVSCVVKSQVKNKLNEMSFEWLNLWMKNLRQHISSMSGKIKRASKDKMSTESKNELKKRSVSDTDKSFTKVSDSFVDDAAKNISPIDAINYYVELKFKEELERLKKETSQRRRSSSKDRNTIIYLPKINVAHSLVRLGETHQSKCHPERETAFARVIPPIQSKQGVRSLLLRMNTLRLAPFPDELDELIYDPAGTSDLITLRYSQKYFVPSSSFVLS